jgi:hypothetical protein
MAKDGTYHTSAGSEAFYEVKRNVERNTSDEEPGQKHESGRSGWHKETGRSRREDEASWPRGLTEHSKKPPDTASGDNGVPEQDGYSGSIVFAGFHGLQTLSIEKL